MPNLGQGKPFPWSFRWRVLVSPESPRQVGGNKGNPGRGTAGAEEGDEVWMNNPSLCLRSHHPWMSQD